MPERASEIASFMVKGFVVAGLLAVDTLIALKKDNEETVHLTVMAAASGAIIGAILRGLLSPVTEVAGEI